MTSLSELPHLAHALSVLSLDIGAALNIDAVIPDKWVERARLAEVELSKIGEDDVITFVIGEEAAQEPFRKANPSSNGLFEDAFDGDLSDVFFTDIDNALDYVKKVEERYNELSAWKQKQVKPQPEG